MPGLSEDDLKRLITGLILTRPWNSDRFRYDEDQTARIVAILRDESDTRMLLDVARADIERLKIEKDEMRSDVARWRWEE